MVDTDDLSDAEFARRHDLHTWFELSIHCVSCSWLTSLDHEWA